MTSQPRLEILIATGNVGKVREIREALSSLPLRLRKLDEFHVTSIDETGQTYEENARLKALGYAKQTGVCALADDSGLEVAALNGRPGVRSARYGGQGLSDRERTEKLLSEIAHLADSDRSARFVCSMALAGWQPAEMNTQTKPQLLHLTEGICDGVLASRARGANGFGFDPIFMPLGYEQTFAELPQNVKNRISHRGRALEVMRQFLFEWLKQT